jgi:zinc protease
MTLDIKFGIFNMKRILSIVILSIGCCVSLYAQETPPAPGAPRSVKIPAVQESTLPNNLKVAVVTRKTVPLVTVQLLVKSGANFEDPKSAGLADMTASLLTKGTKTRTATQIAEEMEFLGGSINAGAGWSSSQVVVNVMPDKLDKAMAIMSDVAINPAFDQKEIDLQKSQTLDGLASSLKQPGFLASYVASRYSFGEHPAGGTVDSINGITSQQIADFHQNEYAPGNAVLIFTGDITALRANALAKKFFGGWKGSEGVDRVAGMMQNEVSTAVVKRILVVDLPNSGQASVNYTKNLPNISRGKSEYYFPASVMNSVLGGGYSSRLNQEIRIKRGLSYGAGSNFSWRSAKSNFSTRTQTKNESAAEVADLVAKEIERLAGSDIPETELTPRKSVLTGDFGRDLETTGGLAGRVADLYLFGLPLTELNAYMSNVNTVTNLQIKNFASANLKGGDIIIVGDAKMFKDDLKKRFPHTDITVIKADELDVSKSDLKK